MFANHCACEQRAVREVGETQEERERMPVRGVDRPFQWLHHRWHVQLATAESKFSVCQARQSINQIRSELRLGQVNLATEGLRHGAIGLARTGQSAHIAGELAARSSLLGKPSGACMHWRCAPVQTKRKKDVRMSRLEQLGLQCCPFDLTARKE